MTAPQLSAAPDTILFDLDGTILDSSRPVLHAWNAALAERSLRPMVTADLSRVIGPPVVATIPEILGERGEDDADVIAEFHTRFVAHIEAVEVEQAAAYPGLVELLHALRDAGRRLAIVTSKPRPSAERVLDALGITELFATVDAPERGVDEPKTITLGRAVRRLDLTPADTVLVGDRHHDVDAGVACGVPVIGVTWGGFTTREELEGAGAVAVIDEVAELPPLLGVDLAVGADA